MGDSDVGLNLGSSCLICADALVGLVVKWYIMGWFGRFGS